MNAEVAEAIEALAWATWLDTRKARVFEEWSRLWQKRVESGQVQVPAGAWETP